MAEMKRIYLKRGDSFVLGCQALDALEAPVPLTDVQVAAQVRDGAGRLVCGLDVLVVDAALGSYELWAPLSGYTDGWPLGELCVDVQYTQPASAVPGARPLRRSSETFALHVQQDVTRP